MQWRSVGGPKIIIKKEEGKERVDAYGDEAQYKTPLENPFVLELLERLGYDSVENFLENSEILNQKFWRVKRLSIFFVIFHIDRCRSVFYNQKHSREISTPLDFIPIKIFLSKSN